MDANGKFVKSVALEYAAILIGGKPDKIKIANAICSFCDGISVSRERCEAAEQYAKCLREQAVAHGIDKMNMNY